MMMGEGKERCKGVIPGSVAGGLLEDPKDRFAIFHVASEVSGRVQFHAEFHGQNIALGAVLSRDSQGVLRAGEISTNVVRGLVELGSESLFGCFAGCLGPISGAEALVVVVSSFQDQESVLRGIPLDFGGLAESVDAPVFVFSPRDRGITVFEKGLPPARVRCRGQ